MLFTNEIIYSQIPTKIFSNETLSGYNYVQNIKRE